MEKCQEIEGKLLFKTLLFCRLEMNIATLSFYRKVRGKYRGKLRGVGFFMDWRVILPSYHPTLPSLPKVLPTYLFRYKKLPFCFSDLFAIITSASVLFSSSLFFLVFYKLDSTPLPCRNVFLFFYTGN